MLISYTGEHRPERITEGSAGFSLIAASVHIEREFAEYSTGLQVAIPDKHVGLVFACSSISSTGWTLCNSVGVIDSDYRGELKLRFYPLNATTTRPYEIGECIGQLVVLALPDVQFQRVNSVTGYDWLGSAEK